MTSRAAVPFLVAMMLLTGVCNTLLTKYQVNAPRTKKPRTSISQATAPFVSLFVAVVAVVAVVANVRASIF